MKFLQLSTALLAAIAGSASAAADVMSAKQEFQPVTLSLTPHHVANERNQRSLATSIPHHGPTMTRDEEEVYRSHYQRRHASSRRRQRSLDEDESDDESMAEAQQLSPLYQGYGTHYVDLWVGTPPQRQTVIVDTGSSVTAFPCSECKDCGAGVHHIDQLFREGDSSSFHSAGCTECSLGKCVHPGNKNEYCQVKVGYAEGSKWYAFESHDTCYLGGPHFHADAADAAAQDAAEDDMDPHHASKLAFNLDFGCQTKIEGLFVTQLADGIMGMDWADASYWKQMFNADKMGPSEQFALCYARQPLPSREGTESGSITLGGVDDRLNDTPMIFTDDMFDEGFFAVAIRKIHLRQGVVVSDGAAAENPRVKMITLPASEELLNKNGIIVDSGTTDTYWETALAPAFHKAYYTLTGKHYSNSGMKLTKDELMALPTILFQLKGDLEANKAVADAHPDTVPGLAGDLDPEHPLDVILAFPPEHYMEYYAPTDRYTPRFYMSEDNGSVLGANAMMGHNILFDMQHNRMGWAESFCDHTHLMKEHDFPFLIDEPAEPTVEDEVEIDRFKTDTEANVTQEFGVDEDEIASKDEVNEDIAPNHASNENSSSQEEEEDADEDAPAQGGGDDEDTGDEDTTDDEDNTGDIDNKPHTEEHEDKKQGKKIDDGTINLHPAVASCTDTTCQAGVVAMLVLMLCCGICIGRCCCAPTQTAKPLYVKSDVEMSDKQFSTYRDEPDDDDDAEYGEGF